MKSLKIPALLVFIGLLTIPQLYGFAKPKKTPEPPDPVFNYNRFSAESADYLQQLSLDEKIGQMTVPTIKLLLHDGGFQLIDSYHLGGVVAIDNSGLPGGEPTLPNWQALTQQINDNPAFINQTPARIPLLLGTYIQQSTKLTTSAVVFPQNIGLGATHDLELIKKVGAWTAYDARENGFNWIYKPVIAVVNNDSQKQIYDSFSGDPLWVQQLAENFISGAQAIKKRFMHGALATAKYTHSDDIKNLSIPDETGCIMIPINFHNKPGHFSGISVSTLDAVARATKNNSSPFADTLADAVNNGIDIFMISDRFPQYYQTISDFQKTLKQDVQQGLISHQQLDKAVQRILRVKLALGLFEPRHKTLSRPSYDETSIARQAAQESLVLLKNDGDVLPLKRYFIENVILLGNAYDDIGSQCGNKNNNDPVDEYTNKKASSIKTGIEKGLRGSVLVIVNPDLTNLGFKLRRLIYTAKNTVVIAALSNTSNGIITFNRPMIEIIKLLKQNNIPVVTVLLSGRPMIITQDAQGQESPDAPLNISDAFVAAWLPGTTGGEAIANALFGVYHFQRKDLTNTLPVPWPKTIEQTNMLSCSNTSPPLLFPCLYGLKD